MSAIPDFVETAGYPLGLLPDGVFPGTEDDLKQRFVEAFPGSLTRATIFAGYLRLRNEVVGYGISATQWVDGSFVEAKLNPNDVDVVSFCDNQLVNGLSWAEREAIWSRLNGQERTIERYQTHGFLVVVYPLGHRYHVLFERSRKYWRDWFGRARFHPDDPMVAETGVPKGFIELTLGDSTKAPKVSHQREKHRANSNSRFHRQPAITGTNPPTVGGSQ